MRKRGQNGLWVIWKVAAVVSFFIYLLIALVRIYYYYYYSDDSDDDVNNNVDLLQQVNPRVVAFMFLVRRDLPLDFLWHTFFLQNGDAANYSIYIHSEPGFVFDETSTRSTFFYGRQLTNSIKVAWGQSTMIEAERLLLRAALQNPANQRFILLSDSCVPLYNFSYIYNYLMGSSKSFVDSFLDMKEGRYNPRMSSVIPMRKWRKGSQWIALIRSHAKVVAYDDIVFPVFKKL
ncbi:glycosyltransferase BC10-like isoform X2 [Bidens hawaiensis]